MYSIGSFNSQSNSFLSIDLPYGKANMYYKESYNPSNRIEDNLLTELSREVVGLVKTQGAADI